VRINRAGSNPVIGMCSSGAAISNLFAKLAIAAQHGRVLFASATTVWDRVVLPFARSLDITKYFQCFFMPSAVAAFFAFPVADVFLVPATVPTGAVGPPLFSQVLAVSSVLAAVRLSGSSQSVVYDVMIDNIRLCAPDRDALLRSWFALLDVLGRLGITVGDAATHDDYAFLGMRFFHAASASERSLGPIVSIAEKTALKLRRARAILVTRPPGHLRCLHFRFDRRRLRTVSRLLYLQVYAQTSE
jgi:hypothetical protein